jgi:hypothetical protein
MRAAGEGNCSVRRALDLRPDLGQERAQCGRVERLQMDRRHARLRLDLREVGQALVELAPGQRDMESAGLAIMDVDACLPLQ